MTRILLIVSALFWLTMNFLLWRAEYGTGKAGAEVPVELVLKKIITAPDNSSLTIYHGRQKSGYCRWTVNTGEVVANSPSGEEPGPEIMESANRGYRLDLDGNLTIPGEKERFQIECELNLATNQEWRNARFRVATHGSSVTLRASAADETVNLGSEQNGVRSDEQFKFADFRNPAGLARAMGVPLPFSLPLPELDSSTNGGILNMAAPALKWEAREDKLMVGHAEVRVYRLYTRFLDKYEVALFISRVGEIMKLELPDGWVLVNDDAGVSPSKK